MASLAYALPAEIERVIALRSKYEALRSLPNVLVEPQIAMMSDLISRALRVSASGDVIEMIRVYEELKGWSE